MFNDFVLQPSHIAAAVTFPDWRHPSALFFVKEGYTEGYERFKKEIQEVTAAMDSREKSVTGMIYCLALTNTPINTSSPPTY